MTYQSAVASMSAGQAAKRPIMGGYIWKDTTGMSEEDIEAGKYMLKVVERDGTMSTFYMNGATGTDSTLRVDAAFFEGLEKDDWEVNSKDVYEDARNGDGRW